MLLSTVGAKKRKSALRASYGHAASCQMSGSHRCPAYGGAGATEAGMKWSKYKMMDRDGLQSTISSGHSQGRGMGGSLVLGESWMLCGQKIAGHRGAEDREGEGHSH